MHFQPADFPSGSKKGAFYRGHFVIWPHVLTITQNISLSGFQIKLTGAYQGQDTAVNKTVWSDSRIPAAPIGKRQSVNKTTLGQHNADVINNT